MLPFYNTGTRTVYKGGIAIPPKETRSIPDHLHPDYKPPVKPKAKVKAPVFDAVALISLSIAELEKELPKLSKAQLDALLSVEDKAEKPRKGVIDAIDAAVLALATQE